jgi:hypothetical protein
MDYELKVVRMALYPADEPTCYAVGFSATADNSRGIYRDTIVSLKDAEGLSDEEIVNLAWIQLGPGIEMEMKDIGARSALIGKQFEPSEAAKIAVSAAVDIIKNPVKQVVEDIMPPYQP